MSGHISRHAASEWFAEGHLVWNSGGTCKERSLGVSVVKGNSQLQGSHLLLIVIHDDKVAIDAVVLGNKLEQRSSDISKGDKVAGML